MVLTSLAKINRVQLTMKRRDAARSAKVGVSHSAEIFRMVVVSKLASSTASSWACGRKKMVTLTFKAHLKPLHDLFIFLRLWAPQRFRQRNKVYQWPRDQKHGEQLAYETVWGGGVGGGMFTESIKKLDGRNVWQSFVRKIIRANEECKNQCWKITQLNTEYSTHFTVRMSKIRVLIFKVTFWE